MAELTMARPHASRERSTVREYSARLATIAAESTVLAVLPGTVSTGAGPFAAGSLYTISGEASTE